MPSTAGRPDPLTLSERRAARTRDDIEAAAIALFTAQGFDATSMEEVAEAAGVSRRTLYRYFDTKSDIVFEAPRRWLSVFEASFAERPAGEPLRDAFRRCLLDVAGYVEEEAEQVLAALAILASSDELGAAHRRSDAAWVQRYLELMGSEAADGPTDPLSSLVLATALVAGQNAVLMAWAQTDLDRDAVDLVRAMLDQLDGAWPDAYRRPPVAPSRCVSTSAGSDRPRRSKP